MYATIYDAVKDLFGWDIIHLKLLQSFGFFVAISFLLCAFTFGRELRRKSREGFLPLSHKTIQINVPYTQNEMFTQSVLGFLLGWKLIGSFVDYENFSKDPRGWTLSPEGSILWGIIAAAASYGYLYFRNQRVAKKEPVNKEIEITAAEHVGSMTLIAALFGFAGAKLFHILENFGDFLENPGTMVFSFAGLTMYGGLICGSIAVVIYAKKKGLNILHVIDACAPGLFLAYGVGRLGCHVSGDGDWGIVNNADKPGWLSWAPDWLWKYDYPNNVNGTMIPNDLDPKYSEPEWQLKMMFTEPENLRLVEPVFPTPLYEAIMCIGLFGIFWAIRKRILTPGFLFAMYLIFNGLERFTIELIRVNTTLFTFGGFRVTQAEFIAFCLVTIGVALAIWTKKRKQDPPPQVKPEPEIVSEAPSIDTAN
jgi:phosphatidylglycerol:prolipoprotein diacylglycerol transferase